MAYATKYRAEFRSSFDGIDWRVDILQDSYTGSITTVKAAGDPLHIVWEKRDDPFNEPFKASTATLRLISTSNFQFVDLFTSSDREFQMAVYRDEVLYWLGYVEANNYSEQFCAPPYEVSVVATDGFAGLKNYPYKAVRTTADDAMVSVRSIMDLVVARLGFTAYECRIAKKPWNTYVSSEPTIHDVEADEAVFLKNSDIDYAEPDATLYDLLEAFLRSTCSCIFQSDGTLYVRDIDVITTGTNYPLLDLFTSGNNILTKETEMSIAPTVGSVDLTIGNPLLDSMATKVKTFEPGSYYVEQQPSSPYPSTWTSTAEILTINKQIRIKNTSKNNGSAAYFEGYILKHFNVKATEKIVNVTFNINIERSPLLYSFPRIVFALRYDASDASSQTICKWWKGSEWAEGSIASPQYIVIDPSGKYNAENVSENVYSPINWQLTVPDNGSMIFYIYFIKNGGITADGFTNVLGVDQTLVLSDIVIKIADEPCDELSFDLPNNGSDSMDIEVPIADVAQVPNNELTYGLMWFDYLGKTTDIWHNGRWADSLARLTVDAVEQLLTAPQKRLTGTLLRPTSLPSLLRGYSDALHTSTRYYLNYLDVDARRDSYGVQLVGYSPIPTTPAVGDDCVRVARIGTFTITKIAKVENRIYFLCGTSLYVYNATIESLRVACVLAGTVVAIQSSGNYLAIIVNDSDVWKVYALDENNTLRPVKVVDSSYPIDSACYSDELGLCAVYHSVVNSVTTYRFYIEKISYIKEVALGTGTIFMPDTRQVIYNETSLCLFYDNRVNESVVESTPTYTYQAITRNLIKTSTNWLFRRTGLSLTARTSAKASYNIPADLTNDIVTFMIDDMNTYYQVYAEGNTTITNAAEATRLAQRKGVFAIDGKIYIVYSGCETTFGRNYVRIYRHFINQS